MESVSEYESQNKAILSYMMSGNAITPIEALNKFWCFRLGARIHNLRQDGHNIKTTMIKRNGKRFAEYSMVKK